MIYLAFISLGLPDSLLGAGWPAMHVYLDVPTPYMGIVSMVVSGGTIISSLMSDKLTRKLGTRNVTVISVFLTAFALLGFSFSTEFWMLLVFAVPYGLGAGCIDAALNNYVAIHYTSRHMSWLHCFWGVGTIISPFVMKYALTHHVWSTGYLIVAVMQLVIGFILLFTMKAWNVNKRADDKKAEHKGLLETLRIKGVPSLLIGFFAYCSAEATAMGWTSTYLVEAHHISAQRAAGAASLFFIGITVGRFISGFVMNRLGDRKMIICGTCIALVGIALMSVPSESALFAAFVVFGLGCAPIYPCIIHSTPDNFGKENSGSIIGIQMASAYVGSTFMPPVFGLLGNYVSFGLMPLYMLIFIALMIGMTETTFRTVRQR